MRLIVVACLGLFLSGPLAAQRTNPEAYLGFDRNTYPGDDSLRGLRATFSFTGYWLNNPPGAKENTWRGKRRVVQSAGFGFLLLFNGKTFRELQSAKDVALLGETDGLAAVKAAVSEGFPRRAVIFLDIEEGGRLLSEQMSYVLSWIDSVDRHGYHAGVYCSGISIREPNGTVINTAQDIQSHAKARGIVFWVSNDSCPPSPGCAKPEKRLPSDSNVAFAEIWQYAQSPRREFAASCRNTYDADGNCYLSRSAAVSKLHLDLNLASSGDPSHARNK